MSEARVLQTTISIDGVMSESLRRSVKKVNQQLASIDKQALATASKIGSNITDAAKTAAKAIAGLGAAAAGLAAGAFIKGGQDYIRTMNGLQVQTGATAAEMQEFGQIAQDVYRSGKGENLQQIADTLANISQASGLAGEELRKAADAAMLLNDSFGMESAETTKAATALMKNFGISAEEAYGMIAYGAQNGANRNGDLLDILNEYSVQYKSLGLTADQFMQSLINGADAGAFSIDKIGDAVKEFNIRAKDGSKTSAEAFKAIGLNAQNITAQFAAGGKVAEAAFFQTVEALNSMQDPMERNAAGVALFGTMFEDLEAGVLDNFESIKGASIDATETLRQIEKVKYNDVGYALTQVGRTLETALIPSAQKAGQAIFEKMPQIQAAIEQVTPTIAALGDSFARALPGIIDAIGQAAQVAYDFGAAIVDNWGVIGPMVYTVAGAFAAFKLAKFAADTYAVGKAVGQLTLAYGRLFVAKAQDAVQTAKIIALYAKDAAAKAFTAARSIAAATAIGIQATATLAWQGVAAIASAATWALGGAIAFLTSPIGLVVAAIAGLVAAGVWLYKNWDMVSAKAAELGAALSAKWTEIKTTVSNLAGQLGSYLSGKWSEIKNTVTGLAGQLGDFVSNVWTKIKNGATSLGDGLKTTLTNAFAAIPGLLKSPVNTAIRLINRAIGAINGIGFTIPDWVPGIGGKAFSVNVPQIPMLAKGGFTQGVTIAGEAGQEAVISFDPAYRAQNIGYLNEAAARLGVSNDSTIGYYAERIGSLGGAGELASSTTNNNKSVTYNLGGVNFAPVMTVTGDSEKKASIIEQLKDYQGDLLDLINELLEQREAASYGAKEAF